MGVPIVVFAASAGGASVVKPALKVLSLDFKDDTPQVGAPPGAPLHGETWIVDTWGAGVYVGSAGGQPYADGDVAQWRADLAGWVRVAQNVGGAPPTGMTGVVAAAAAGGSFGGKIDQTFLWDGSTFLFTKPVDGDVVEVTGPETIYENQAFMWDDDIAVWKSMGRGSLNFGTTHFVAKNGNDDVADGSLERPYASWAAAIAAASPGDTVAGFPGTYQESGLVLNKDLDLVEICPNTVIIEDTAPGGIILSILGPCIANITVSIRNLNNANVTDRAIRIDASGGQVTLRLEPYIIDAGQSGRALEIQGDIAGLNSQRTDIKKGIITGNLYLDSYGSDRVFMNAVELAGATPNLMNITGSGGSLIIVDTLHEFGPGQTIDFGGGLACGVTLGIGASYISGVLKLNNAGGTGYVILCEGNQVVRIDAVQPAQLVQKFLGAEEWEFVLYNIPGAAPFVGVMYAVPVGRRFLPYAAQVVNRFPVATALGTTTQFDGTGPGSIVAPVVAPLGILPGVRNEIVLQDSIPAGGSVRFNQTVAPGPGLALDAKVKGMLT